MPGLRPVRMLGRRQGPFSPSTLNQEFRHLRLGVGKTWPLRTLTLHLPPLAWTKSSNQHLLKSGPPLLNVFAKILTFSGLGLPEAPAAFNNLMCAGVPPSSPIPPSPKQTKQSRLRKNTLQIVCGPNICPEKNSLPGWKQTLKSFLGRSRNS